MKSGFFESLLAVAVLPCVSLMAPLCNTASAQIVDVVKSQKALNYFEPCMALLLVNMEAAPKEANPKESKLREVLLSACKRSTQQSRFSEAKTQQQSASDARSEIEAGRANTCETATEGAAVSAAAPIETLPFNPDLALQHPAGRIYIRRVVVTPWVAVGGKPTFGAIPGETLIYVDFEFGVESDNQFKSAIINSMIIETADGKSLLTPRLLIAISPRKAELWNNPQSLQLLSNLVETVSVDTARTIAVHQGWMGVGAVKSGISPIFLRFPCVAERMQLADGT